LSLKIYKNGQGFQKRVSFVKILPRNLAVQGGEPRIDEIYYRVAEEVYKEFVLAPMHREHYNNGRARRVE
jgi:hypothetical protein